MPLPEGRKPLDEKWFHQHNQICVDRVEVIDSNGRSYAEYEASDVEIRGDDD